MMEKHKKILFHTNIAYDPMVLDPDPMSFRLVLGHLTFDEDEF